MWLAVVVAAATFAFRYLTYSGFPNDHFVHLSAAQQMLLGEWPVRDFVERGMPLMSGASAAAQLAFGAGVESELVLVAAGFAVAAGALAWVVARSTHSALAAVVAAAAIVVAFPTSYAYPKHLVYALGLAAAWAYGVSPTRVRLGVLGAMVAAAFLFRHDHGVLLGAGAFVFVVARHARETRMFRTAALFLAIVALCLAPYVLWVQAQEGIGQYMRDGIEFSRREAERTSRWDAMPSFRRDASDHASAVAPLWARDNAVAVLFYVVWVLPLLTGAVLLASSSIRGGAAAPVLLMAAVVQLGMNLSMIREPVELRIRDVLVPAMLLAASLAVMAWRCRPTPLRLAVRAATAAAMTVLVVGCGMAGNVREQVNRMVADGAGIDARLRELSAEFVAWRARTGRIADSEMAVAGYVTRCTAPTARIFVMGFKPELYFYSGRGFAGGHVALSAGYYATARDEALMLARLSQADVPLAFVDTEVGAELRRAYPAVAAHLDTRYVDVGRFPLRGRELVVYADRARMPAQADAQTGMPCFAAASRLARAASGAMS